MPRRTNDFTLGEALTDYLAQSHLLDRALAQRAIQEWPQIVGKPLADATKAVWWQDGIFHLQLDSPLWKQEVSYRRQELVACINTYLGQPIAKDVVLA